MSDERDERLKEIEARVNAATEGPWHWTAGMMAEGSERTYAGYPQQIHGRNSDPDDGTYPVLVAQLFEGHEDEAPPNTEFLTHAREDIPWLTEQLRAKSENSGAAIVSESPRPDDLIAKMLYAMIHEAKAAQWRRDTEMDKITERIEEQREHGIGPPNQVDWSHHSMLVGHLIGTRNALRILQEFASKGTATLSVAPESGEG